MHTDVGPGPSRPGQMTAVMRAAAPGMGAKVLRIGLVQRGRIVEERIIKQHVSVTVGTRETSMFVLRAENMPVQFELFERVGGDYYLNLLDEMSGRIALGTGVHEVHELRQAGRAGGRLRLTEDARGKVVLGETTFLFQFVAPPPVQPHPQLPLAVKGDFASPIDWNVTIIAAFSFLLHFGFIGAMYSDWMDPQVDTDFTVRLLDPGKSLPTVATETPAEGPAETMASNTMGTSESKRDSVESKRDSVERKTSARSSRSEDHAALSEQAEAMEMQLLAAFGGSAVVDGALRQTEIPLPDLSHVAESGAGARRTGDQLRLGSGQAVIRPGAISGGLASIGEKKGGSVGAGPRDEVATKGPMVDARIDRPTVSVPLSDAEQVIASLRPKLRNCYVNRGLASDPGMAGGVTIVAKVGPNGEVSAAESANVSGLSSDVVSCIQRVVRGAQFAAPGGTGSTIHIPVKFVQQGK